MVDEDEDSTETFNAFEQVECIDPDVREKVDEMADESDTWIIEWEDGRSRETALVGLAWWAREHDPEAEVSPI